MRLLCRCSTTMRLFVLLLLCTHISITYAAVLDSCVNSADCDSTPNTDCTGSPLKCNCDTGFKGNIGDAGCIAKTVGDSCTGDSDCVYIARAECPAGTCTCSAGYIGANGADFCSVIHCGAPDTPGYVFGTPSPSTSYGDSVGVTGCANGYEGSPTPSLLYCEASGNWTVHEGCIIKDCGTPTADTGYVVGLYPATTYESSSTITCATGYEGTPADITCTAGGTWSTQTGCTIVNCGTPTADTGYAVDSAPVTTYEGISTMACAIGYEGSASNITCTSGGTWSSQTGCTIVDCGAPSETGYEFMSITATSYLATADVHCAVGYEGTPSPAQITCQDTGNWETVTDCNIKDCSAPTADTGYVVVSAPITTYEGISTMTCATGFEGTAANITCTNAGTWSIQTGCTIKDCGTPSETGYEFISFTSTSYLGTVDVHCAVGYEGTPSPAQITCQDTGNWETVTSCNIKDCSAPTADTGYAVVSAPVTTYGGISTMTCATGYEGTAVNITCTDAATWSTQTGCTIVDCGAPDTPGYVFGTPSPSTTYGDSVDLTGCATGYEGSPTSSLLYCEASGSWTAHEGCIIKDCATPPTADIGYVVDSVSTTTYGSRSTMTCDIGYDGTAAAVTCTAAGTWSTQTGCSIVNCGTPTANTGYAVESAPVTTYEGISTMACDTGYEGSASNITCTSAGTWSSQTGCTIVDCGTPSETGYEFISITATSFLGTADVHCAVGYEGTPSPAQITCQDTGNWETVTSCNIKDCGTPTADTGYAVVSAPVTTYEGISTMTCATGYEGTAVNITCTAAGTWSTQTGCTIVDCGAPDTPGYVFGTPSPSTTYGDSVDLTGCATGYEGSPTPSLLYCEASGSWTAHEGCIIKDCGTPTADTGYVIDPLSSTAYGSSSTMRCATGYEGTPANITCTAVGNWSTQTGCTIVSCQFGKFGHGCIETCPCILSNIQSCDAETGACTCKSGWTGNSCSLDINECSSAEIHGCPPGSICTNTIGSYFCQCDTCDTADSCQGLTVALGTVSGVLGAVILTLIAVIIALIFKLRNRGNGTKRGIMTTIETASESDQKNNPNYELTAASASQRDYDTYDSLDSASRDNR